MGFFDTLVEGLSSAVHTVATVATTASQIASTMGQVGSLVAQDKEQLDPVTTPVVEALRANCQLAENVLKMKAKVALGEKKGEKDIAISNPQIITGLVRKMRVLSLNSITAGVQVTSVTQSTGLMYKDLAFILSQMGAPLSGLYGGELPTRDNAQYAADQLFINAVEVDPAEPVVTTSSVILNDEYGAPKFKIAHAGYNLRLDETGENDVSHSCFAYGGDESISEIQLAQERKARRAAGGDLIARPLATPDLTVQGFGVVVAVGVRTLPIAIPISLQLQVFATQVESWTVANIVVGGAVITLNILTATSPLAIQCDIIDWVAGRLNSPTVAPPETKPDLTEVVIVSSVPQMVPAPVPASGPSEYT